MLTCSGGLHGALSAVVTAAALQAATGWLQDTLLSLLRRLGWVCIWLGRLVRWPSAACPRKATP